ncbi:MAG TPA: tannase/feruloyl esterase family alpha/beta hydrolase [Burkholderiaceae bacterium]|nr:tannase/feruloyl esterase family alpha/beta hydrolase [Burkholderiaceae bacterium]
MNSRSFRSSALLISVALGAVASGCSSDNDDEPAPPPPPPVAQLECDDSMKTAFNPDDDTEVIFVKSYRQGDALALSGAGGPTAAADLCLVKMVVGPGFQDGADAPSTSPGIGIEIWLPTREAWNGRIRNLGGGGWAGGNHASTSALGSTSAASVAATANFVVGTTDTGHRIGNGSFAMRQDGGINTALWTDFAERSLHELAVKSKALALAYYGREQDYAYWEGCSTGGRQGYKIAQEHPDDYDGYLNGAPAFNWTRFITSELYPQIVMQRDLGGPMPMDKQNLMSAAAVSACDIVGGQHLGFIPDTQQCRYDPTKDASMLCDGVQGNAGVVGTSTNAACVNLAEATAMNKIWYGQTHDGSVPDPAVDNGSTPTLTAGTHLWWGLTRGTTTAGLAGPNPFTIATDTVALSLQDPGYATPTFVNATGNGADRWKDISYAELAHAYHQGVALQEFFGNINTDKADLRGARDSGAKILSYHGLADQLITPAGSINYYTRAAALMGGNVELNRFNRLYLVPALGHCAGVGTVSGTEGPVADANSVPLPAQNQWFDALVDWVENGVVPQSIVLESANASVSMPVCPYPQKAVYGGSGPITEAASYSCR